MALRSSRYVGGLNNIYDTARDTEELNRFLGSLNLSGPGGLSLNLSGPGGLSQTQIKDLRTDIIDASTGGGYSSVLTNNQLRRIEPEILALDAEVSNLPDELSYKEAVWPSTPQVELSIPGAVSLSDYIPLSEADMAARGIFVISRELPLIPYIQGDNNRALSLEGKPSSPFIDSEGIPVFEGLGQDNKLSFSNPYGDQIKYLRLQDIRAPDLLTRSLGSGYGYGLSLVYSRTLFEIIINDHEILLPRLLMVYGFVVQNLRIDQAVTLATWLLACINLNIGIIPPGPTYLTTVYLSGLDSSDIDTLSSNVQRMGSGDGQIIGNGQSNTLRRSNSSDGFDDINNDTVYGEDYISKLWSLATGLKAPVYLNEQGTPIIDTNRYKIVMNYPLRLAYWLALMYNSSQFYISCVPIYQFLAIQKPHPVEQYALFLGEDRAQWPSKMLIIRERIQSLNVPRDIFTGEDFFRELHWIKWAWDEQLEKIINKEKGSS